MRDLSNDLGSLRSLCQKLRVPELKYLQEYGSDSASLLSEEALKNSFIRETDLERYSIEGSILDILSTHFNSPQKSSVNNIAFVLDRAFDVWLRKNNFPSELERIYSFWRFALFATTLYEQKVFSLDGIAQKQVLESLVDLLETMADDSLGWSPVPERSKHVVLDQVINVSNRVLKETHSDLTSIDQAACEWLAFQAKQSAKLDKVCDRLIKLEGQQCWKRFSYWCAQSYIDLLFTNKKLPESLQCFLDAYWVRAVAESLSCDDGVNVILDCSVIKLTNAAMNAFCVQGDELFKHADTLVDDFKTKLDSISIDYDVSVFTALEASLVSLLKQEFTDSFVLYSSIPMDSSVSDQFSHYDISQLVKSADLNPELETSVDYGLKIDDWYVLGQDQADAPIMRLLAYFKYAGAYLFANHLGMKTALYSKKEMANLIKAKELKPLKKGESFSAVFSSCLKGLTRVAESQQKARIAAAEKAKEEAERLLEEKRKAEEEAARRAEEIAQRTKELLKKREEKLKADKQAEALNLIQQLNIGAWVALTLEEASERYKLVVKIAASGKCIFVDKLGIKKKEYKEEDLIEMFLSNRLEFLSDGAEFEDSLQRVVSRLRMAK